MLYKKESIGTFVPAEKQEVIAEAKRIYSYSLRRGRKIENPSLAGDAMQARLVNKQHEVFACLFLDSQHRILGFDELFRGTIDGASIHPREVVKEALTCKCSGSRLCPQSPVRQS